MQYVPPTHTICTWSRLAGSGSGSGFRSRASLFRRHGLGGAVLEAQSQLRGSNLKARAECVLHLQVTPTTQKEVTEFAAVLHHGVGLNV